MRKLTLLIGALAMTLASNAQSYKLTDMSEETFAAGGDSQWSFEKYNYGTGTYSKLTTYGDSSTCNYVDIYQPERVAGQRITEIEGVTANGENTWAANNRKAWYDSKFESVRTNSMDKFVYVCRDTREGFGFELYGNPDNSSIVTFTAPADGYYKVNGTVIREDLPERPGLNIVPRFRYASATDINYVNSKSTMGLKFVYGENGGQLEDYDGNGNLVKGGTQQFVAQQPSSFDFAVKAKAGDKLSFEVNVEAMNLNTAWARDAYGRTFFRQLDVETIDEATATASANYVDPYGTANVANLQELLNKMSDDLMEIDGNGLVGNEYGDYTQEAADVLNQLFSDITTLLENNGVNEMNAVVYVDQLNNAWNVFLASKITMDFNADNNYRMISSTGSQANGNLKISTDLSMMATNEDNPWGFYSYEVAKGIYNKLTAHDKNNKNKADTLAWNRGNAWFWIGDDATLHPETTYSPTIMFTAPEDGVYKVYAQVYRLNPNTKVNNATYLRSRFLSKTTEVCDTATYMYAKPYGTTADGQNGLAPVALEYFVNLKQGDRITFEEDCYLANSNGSAGSQLMNLYVCSRESNDKVFTVDSAKVSEVSFYDPYQLGDATNLKAAVAKADSISKAHAGELGTADGQYSQEKYDALQSLIGTANEWIALEGDESATQLTYDTQVLELEKAVTAFLDSRLGFHKVIEGTHSLRLAGTQTYLTRKQSSGDHYYMAYMTYADVETQATKDGLQVTDFSWTYTFTPSAENPNIYSITNAGGYMTADAYVGVGIDPTPEKNTFELLTKEDGDSTFAVRRADGLYWKNTKSWKSPYDKIDTSSEPQFIFVLDAKTIEDVYNGIDNVNVSGDSRLVKTEYFTLDGRKTNAEAKGLLIVRDTFADGTTKAVKKVVK